MADKKISDLTNRTPVDGNEYVELAHDGSSYKGKLQDIFDELGGGGGGSSSSVSPWFLQSPNAAEFSFFGDPGSSIATNLDPLTGLICDVTPAGSGKISSLLKELANKNDPWELEFHVMPNHAAFEMVIGVVLYDEVSGIYIIDGCYLPSDSYSGMPFGRVDTTRFDNYSTYSYNFRNSTNPRHFRDGGFIKIQHDGTNYKFWRSSNGRNYQTLNTSFPNDYLEFGNTDQLPNKASHVGFGVAIFSTTLEYRPQFIVDRWKLTES